MSNLSDFIVKLGYHMVFLLLLSQNLIVPNFFLKYNLLSKESQVMKIFAH